MTDQERDNDRPLKGGGPTPPADEARTMDLGPVPAAAELEVRYDLLGEIGRGGMGIVYKARDRETGDVVALKVLQPDISGRPELIERFKSELLLARKITHKNVCRTHELLRFGSTVAIAMEYVEGESLRAVLNRSQGVSLRYGLGLLRQALAGLAEAHAQGVVHRDLKPENILIARDGTVKVMDFGIARSLESGAAATGAIVGTPAYMSPEQAEGKPADARSDIYSLGLIMYEVFTGAQAFRAETPVALAMKQVRETPPPPRERDPHLPIFLERAIQKCLEKTPARRFQSVKDLEAALSEKGEPKVPAAGEEVELPVNLTRWQRSDWLLVGAGMVGLALFFPFFNRTSLAPRTKVTFDRGALRRIAQEYAQRLGAPATGNPSVQLWWFGDAHDYVARHSGAQAALELTNNPVPYWVWLISWPDDTEVRVDHRGSLIYFSRGFPATLAIERGPPDAERQVAERDLREFFGRDPSLLTLEMTSNVLWFSRQPATSFLWLDRHDYRGLKHRYRAVVIGSQTVMLGEGYYYPEPEVVPLQEEGWQTLPGVALGLALLILGISQRRQVVLGARWHIAFVGLGFIMGLYSGLLLSAPVGGVGKVLITVLGGVAFGFVGFFFIITLERAVGRIWPNKLSSLVRFFDRRAISEPCGLAVLRGAFIGLALLGLDALLVWLGTSHLGMRLDSAVLTMEPARSAPIGTGWSVTFVTIKEIYQAAYVAFVLSFLASFFARLIRRRWLALCVAAALATATISWLALNMGAVQPYPGKFAILVLECLLLTWALSRFDVLTVVWSAFTFAFCWADYYLLVMFEPTGALEQWVAFAVFGAVVAAAAAVAFKSPLRQAYGRMAAAFE